MEQTVDLCKAWRDHAEHAVEKTISENAKKAFEKNLDLETVAYITGLSHEKLVEIQKEVSETL